MMKKLLVLLPFVMMGISPAGAFSDVTSTTTHGEAITFVQQEGIVQGYEDGTYRPEEAINRVEFIKILLLSTDLTERPCTKRFFIYSDTEQNAWYNGFLQTAGNCGIATGYPDGSFKPEQPINFAEAAKIILETKDLHMCPSLAFTTYAADAPWYTPYLICMDEYNAFPDNVQPADLVTRGEMAQMIFNLHQHQSMPTSEVITMNVEAHTKECVGVGPMDCLVVNGSLFYDNIAGFTHTDGFTYTLEVEKTNNPLPLPADSSAYSYRLIEITSETPTADAFIGMSEDEATTMAEAHNISFRVVERDGESLPVTLDFRPGRINAVVENDTVISYTIEGEESVSTNNYVGLTEEQATTLAAKNNVAFRVVQRDGEELAVDMDYVPGRINADITDGIVTTYTIEGSSENFVNLSEEAAALIAEERGISFRVVKRDGEDLLTTDDYVVGRINAVVADGIVVSYTIEGESTDYVGLSEEEARALTSAQNIPFRVVKRDGEDLMITMDYVSGRINAEVENGTVTAYTVE